MASADVYSHRNLSSDELHEIKQLTWSDWEKNREDIDRWHQQGFQYSSSVSFGLKQNHGGPCGVLASVQAEILLQLLFVNNPDFKKKYVEVEEHKDEGYIVDNLKKLDEAEQKILLARAIASILINMLPETECSETQFVKIVHQKDATSFSFDTNAAEFVVTSVLPNKLYEVIFSLCHQFSLNCGVLILLYSAILTRGIQNIKNDMDDPSNSLTGQFGYCTQEIINLMLCGRAVSNVFDGTVPMGESGLTLKGIPVRSQIGTSIITLFSSLGCVFPRVLSIIGYLTHLEALRYCQVGSYYKSPLYPVWVIGSSSHFSVLFGLEKSICEDSFSESILLNLRRIFKSFDPHENGFIEVNKLTSILQSVGIDKLDENRLQLLGRKLEVPGSGIILWDEFWKRISILVATNDFERCIENRGSMMACPKVPRLERSDSDFARELQMKFDIENDDSESVGRLRSDSDVARELQDQFDLDGIEAESKEETSSTTMKDKSGKLMKFDLFHYNGLQGPSGRKAKIVHVSIENKVVDYIGTSAALDDSLTTGGHGCPIEDVIKTRWPHVTNIYWHEQPPPSID